MKKLILLLMLFNCINFSFSQSRDFDFSLLLSSENCGIDMYVVSFDSFSRTPITENDIRVNPEIEFKIHDFTEYSVGIIKNICYLDDVNSRDKRIVIDILINEKIVRTFSIGNKKAVSLLMDLLKSSLIWIEP